MSEKNPSTSEPQGALRPTGKRQRAGQAAPAKAASASSVTKAPEVVKTRRNPFTAIIDYLRGVVSEMAKVIWPTGREMVTYTIVVIIFLVIITALVAGVDFGVGKLVSLVLS